MTRKDGGFTPYSNANSLEQNLQTALPVALDPAAAQQAMQNAIRGLSDLPGPRLLLIDPGGQADPSLLQQAGELANPISPVYLLDGGIRTRESQQEIEPTPQNPGMWGLRTVSKRKLEDRISHEVSWKTAIKDMLADSRYQNEITCELPASDRTSEDTFSLNINASNNPALLPGTVKAELYRVSPQVVNGKTTVPRLTVRQPLLTHTVFENGARAATGR